MLDTESPRQAEPSIVVACPKEWLLVHANLIELSAQASHLDWKLGCELLRAVRARCHTHLGYGGIVEYADRIFGYDGHTTNERLRVARCLEDLPQLSEALRTGETNSSRPAFGRARRTFPLIRRLTPAKRSAVRELTRVATPETEEKWLDAARNLRVREVQKLVRGHRPGDSPGDPPDPTAEKHVLRFEVSDETFATFQEARANLQRKSEAPLDDDAFLMLMAREVLRGPSDEGRANYQIALTTCEQCGQTWQEGNGALVPVTDAVREKAQCDAQNIGHLDALTPERASQSIPPATRRLVKRRHAGACGVRGCFHATFVDVHHTELRSEGAGHDPDKLIALCSRHHDAVHLGQLAIRGTASTGFTFWHADGRPYGTPPSELRRAAPTSTPRSSAL